MEQLLDKMSPQLTPADLGLLILTSGPLLSSAPGTDSVSLRLFRGGPRPVGAEEGQGGREHAQGAQRTAREQAAQESLQRAHKSPLVPDKNEAWGRRSR